MVIIKPMFINENYSITLDRIGYILSYEANKDEVTDIMNNKSKHVVFRISDHYTFLHKEIAEAIVKNEISIDIKLGDEGYILCIFKDNERMNIVAETRDEKVSSHELSEKDESKVILCEIKSMGKEHHIEDVRYSKDYSRKRYEMEYNMNHTYTQTGEGRIKYIYKDKGTLMQSAYFF